MAMQAMWNMVCRGTACLLLAAGFAPAGQAQERFSIFVPSEQANVERMLRLSGVRDDDVIVDLGSGDGRVVLTAAKLNRKVRGFGVDIDQKLVDQANAAAKEQGVADRVQFFHRNAFDADLSGVTIIAMWMWPEIQRMLRTKILAEARPGTRVITNLWDMGSWTPDHADSDGPTVNMWVVPAKVAGNWTWELPLGGTRKTFHAVKEQQFQRLEGVVRVDGRRGVVTDYKLQGEAISFNLGMTVEGVGYVRHEFSGKVQGDRMEGTARITLPPDHDKPVMAPWRATRVPVSGWFAPTGVDAK